MNSLREELERNDIEHQEAMQRATSLAQDENRQLKGTVNSLREVGEDSDWSRERVQRAVSVSEDEVKQLKGT